MAEEICKCGHSENDHFEGANPICEDEILENDPDSDSFTTKCKICNCLEYNRIVGEAPEYLQGYLSDRFGLKWIYNGV